MSSAATAPPSAHMSAHHRHTSSGDSGKFEEALPERVVVGQPSSSTFYVHDDYSAYPNNWAKIRLATGIIYYSPDAHVMS